MAEDRDDQQSNETEGQQNQPQTTDQQGQQQPGQQQQGQETMSGQPIGGNDSNSGSGTPLSQGADVGGQSSGEQTSSSGQASQSGDTETLSGQQDTSGSGGSSGGTGGSSGGEGFIGSQGTDSDEYVQDNATGQSGSDESDKTDFADQGQGATDEQDEDSESGFRWIGRKLLSRLKRRRAAFPVRERGVALGGLLREERGFAFDPLGKARPRQDAVDVGERARISVRADSRRGMAEIGEWTRDCNVGQRQAVADQISIVARDHLFQIVEDRRQIVELGLFGRLVIARTAEETRRDDLVEEDFRAAR